MRIEFEVIEPRSGSNSYPSLVGHPWGRKMKANISMDKYKLKSKEKIKRSLSLLTQDMVDLGKSPMTMMQMFDIFIKSYRIMKIPWS